MGIFVKLWLFYDHHLPNMVMSSDPTLKFFFFPILHLILREDTKFPVEKLSTSEVIAKNFTGGIAPPPPQCFQG